MDSLCIPDISFGAVLWSPASGWWSNICCLLAWMFLTSGLQPGDSVDKYVATCEKLHQNFVA
jgi:hypothetical protein